VRGQPVSVRAFTCAGAAASCRVPKSRR
jgi:hypothetical protein